MAEPPSQQSRRLCGVLLADVTGYSRLMRDDEPRAIAALNRIRDVFTTIVPRHNGTLDVFVGDCFVALFGSAVDAVQAAVAIQNELAAAAGPAGDPVRIRIGVHLGEVVRAGNEVFGDSINVAARVQAIARPGCVNVSEDVHRAVRNKVPGPFRDLGVKQLKNVGRVRVYEVALDSDGEGPAHGPATLRPLVLGGAGVAALLAIGFVAYQAALRPGPPPVAGPAPAAAPAAARAPTRGAEPAPDGQPITIGVMGIAARGEVPDWMREVARDGFNTILSKVNGLRVFSRQKIDFVREKRGLGELEAAETLGIAKMISGALAMDGPSLVLEVQVIDIGSGLLDASERIDGKPSELIELQNKLAMNVLQAMHVNLTPEERTLIFAKRTNDMLDGYKMLADTMGGTGGGPPPPPPPQGRTSWLAWPAIAHAESPADDEGAIRGVLEAYRAALQAKDLPRISTLQLEMDDAQRASLTRYFENAGQLVVTLGEVDVLVEGDDALATFTRNDTFVDARSGRPMQLEVRLSSTLTRRDGAWKIRAFKKG